jgi:hypothetical protein
VALGSDGSETAGLGEIALEKKNPNKYFVNKHI